MLQKDKYSVINIRKYLESDDQRLGEEDLIQILSEFSCEKNPDVERFLKKSSIEFTKKNQSITYIVPVSYTHLIELEDAFENMGAQLVKEVATKTNDVAGDGTTTATVLAQAMVNAGMKNLAAGANPIILRKGMRKATETAVEAIRKMSSKVNGKEHIARVAAISAGDETVGQLVADAMEKVSGDGVITIEESKTMQTELDLVEGMQFDRGYISAYMATDMDKMEAVLDNPYILITDKKISNIQEILPLLEQIVQSGAKLLILSLIHIWNFTDIWGMTWSENFITVDTNSTDGITWSGWRK